MENFRTALLAEIEFWQELMNEWKLSRNSPEFQRMEQALQLAQVKLSRHENHLIDNADIHGSH